MLKVPLAGRLNQLVPAPSKDYRLCTGLETLNPKQREVRFLQLQEGTAYTREPHGLREV